MTLQVSSITFAVILDPLRLAFPICTAEAPATANEVSLCRKIKKSEGRRHRGLSNLFQGTKQTAESYKTKALQDSRSWNVFECKWRWQECVLGWEFSWEWGFLKQHLILDVLKLQAQLWQLSIWKERESRTGKAQPMSPKLQAVALTAIKGAAQQAAAWGC